MDLHELAASVEAILFAAGDAVDRAVLCQTLEVSPMELDSAVQEIRNRYDFNHAGIRLICLEDKLQLGTRPEYIDAVNAVLMPVRRQALSTAVLETLSVVAYSQPVTRADIEAVRGVRSDHAVNTLVQQGLIHEVGRKEVIGRPILYGTTIEFLRHFGLESLDDLPPLEEPEQPQETMENI